MSVLDGQESYHMEDPQMTKTSSHPSMVLLRTESYHYKLGHIQDERAAKEKKKKMNSKADCA